MLLFDLKKKREEALAKADTIVAAAERQSRKLTDAEQTSVDACLAEVNVLNAKVKVIESQNTLRGQLTDGMLILGNGGIGAKITKPQPRVLTAEYVQDFLEFVQSGGHKVSAALYEGSNAAGGFAVPVVVDQQIVPLAPQEMGVRQLATVIATTMDVKMPIKGAPERRLLSPKVTAPALACLAAPRPLWHRRRSPRLWPGTFWTCLGNLSRTSRVLASSLPMTSSLRSSSMKSRSLSPARVLASPKVC